MAVISSNALFHFTPKLEYLIEMLEKGVWPRYCLESIWSKYDFALPMACFCDIPLSQIINHVEHYGGYGIGVTKKWAIENQVSPVFYLSSKSTMRKRMTNILKNIKEGKKVKDFDYLFLSYMKKTKGNYKEVKNGMWYIKKNYPFYDEKEWRYVPYSDILKGHFKVMEGNECVSFNLEKESQYNEHNRLKLKMEDIVYIIVPDDDERKKMIKKIYKRKIGRNSFDNEILTSKILTKKQIKEDF